MLDLQDSVATLGTTTRKVSSPNGTTLSAQIHILLEEAVIQGDISPSSRLNADDIAAEFGVSRIPVREALRSLHEAGWVEIRPRHGVYVRARSMTELRELFEARSGIEGEIARLAAQRRTAGDVEQLRRILDRGYAASRTKDPDGTAQASTEFNQTIRHACKNTVLANLSTTLEKRAKFYFAMVEGRLGADWLTINRDLLERIEAGDDEGAEKITRTHITNTGNEVSKLLEAEETV